MKKKALTLLELTIVLLIIGVLTTLAVNEYINSQKLSRMHIFEANVNEIEKALNTYRGNQVLSGLQTSMYPISLSDPQFKTLFKQAPINPYTGKTMLSNNPDESGILYVSDGLTYILCVAQKDVNDINKNNDTHEPLPVTTARICGSVTPTLPQIYYITFITNPTNAGFPIASPNPANAGEQIVLTPNPNNCHIFTSWSSNDVTISNNTFSMPANDIVITANYTTKQYNISVISNNMLYGTVTGSGTYNCGNTATIVAIPNTGYKFVGWYENNALVTTSTTYIFTVNSNRTLEAHFRSLTYTIVVTASPVGVGTQTATPNPAYVGQTVTLSATPTSCYKFSGWLSPDVTISNPLSPTASFIMPEKNATIIANYIIQKYTITATNVQYGTVTGTGTYNCGSTATLIAVPNTGYMFIGWYENGISLTASTMYIFTVSSTRTLEARFKQVEYHTITIIETTQTDFSSGTLANVTATNGNITLDGQNQPNKEIIQQNTPYILPDAFWNGSKYKYIVFATSTPNFTGGSGVSIINRGIANPAQTSDVGNSYEITSSTRITSITANGVTLSNFTYREGDIFWYGPWWDAAVAQTIPSGYDIAFAIGRTENLGTSSWVVRLDGVDTAFSTNVANHYFRAPINSSTSHSILVTYITGWKGIQFAYWGYAKAYPSSGTRTSPIYNIATAGAVESATITWTANTPVGTSVTVETRVSLDGGATWSSWQTVASGSAVPGLPKGTNLANARIQLRQTLSTTNSATTPQLQDVRIQIVSTATGGIRVDVKQIP